MLHRNLLFLLGLVPAALAAQQDRPLTLHEAVLLGRRHGVQGELAQLESAAADARVGERRADLLPTLGGQAGISRQTNNLSEFGLSVPGFPAVTDPFTLYALRGRATQTLFNGASLSRLRGTGADARAAGYDARAARDRAGLQAGLAWLRAVSTAETVKAREADSVVAADLLRMARQQLQAGVSAAIDVTRAEVNMAAIRGQLLSARNERDQARLELNRALNVPADTAIVLSDTLDAVTTDLPVDADSAVAYAVAHRPETAAARERTRAAQLQRRAITWENLPSVEAFGQINQTGIQLDTLRFTWSLGVQVSVPLFDGLRRQRRAAEQSARLAAQDLRERDLRRTVEVEARSALLDLASARGAVEVAQERLRLADQEMRQAEERFAAGAAGSVETSQAQLGLSAARDGLIQAKVNLSSARVRAYGALGAFDQMQ